MYIKEERLEYPVMSKESGKCPESRDTEWQYLENIFSCFASFIIAWSAISSIPTQETAS